MKVDVGCETRADVTLVVETMEQAVEVTANAPVLQQDSSSLGEVVDTRQVVELPLNGRDFRRLAFLLPSAAPRSPRGSLGSFTVNGQREKSNIFLIDGVDNNDSFRNQASFNQGGVGGAQATLFPIDALAEFSIQTQGSAEYGRNSGAVVNTVIKSGTNELHGTLYELLRNDMLNARNFFETLPGTTRGPFKNSNYGGKVGGPILHDRTFFLPVSKANEDGPVLRWPLLCRAQKTLPLRGRRTRLPAGLRTRWALIYSASFRRRTFQESKLIKPIAFRTSSTATTFWLRSITGLVTGST